MRGSMGRAQVFFALFFSFTRPAAADVLQHHNQSNRDGLYVDPLFTRQSAAGIHRDYNFQAALPGPTHAQPLYVTSGPGGIPALIVATEQNQVLALNAINGATLWQRNLGTPVAFLNLPCKTITVDPLGITGTPAIDAASRMIYVAAMTTPDGGVSVQHLIFALSLEDGSTLSGWPVDVSASVSYRGLSFNSGVENQRGALVLSGGVLYVPYGGLVEGCPFHGWVVGVPVDDPANPMAWATDGLQGGSWASGGLAVDGTSIYAATGNTDGTSTWAGGEAIIRLNAGPVFTGAPADFFTPSNWLALDIADLDLGGTGPLLLDVPGATPSALVVALGKNGVAYLIDRMNFGGIGTGDGTRGEGVASELVSTGQIINAAAAYTTGSGTYVVFNSYSGRGVGCPTGSGDLVALRIGASAPPTISVAWCADNQGRGSPIVTTTNGSSEPVVWTVGGEASNRLHAFDGETGSLLFAGGGAAEQMTRSYHFQTPIAVNGRIIVAADNQLYAFTMQPSSGVSFQAPQTLVAGGTPESVAVGDFNGDGAADLAVANYIAAGTVTVLLGNGDGSFQAPRAFSTGGRYPFSVAVGDLNGDGRPDLAVVNVSSNSASVLLGNGDGTFQVPRSFATGGTPISVAVGDFNGDGAADLAAVNITSNNISSLLGNGDGTFQMPRSFATGGTPISVAVGDFNGDGRLDLAVANQASDNVSVLLGNGDGTFQAARSFAAGSFPWSVAVGDFDGDGVPDLVVANQNSSDVSVLLGNVDGAFQVPRSFAAGSTPMSVAVGDFNGDGRLDLAVANRDSNRVSVLINGTGL